MSNFWKRTLSGIVFVALIIFAVFANYQVTGIIFSILAALSVYEFHKNTNQLENVNVNPFIPTIASFVLLLIYVVDRSGSFFSCYFIFYLYIFIAEIFRKKINPINNIAYTILGQMYIVLPFLLMFLIRINGEIFLLALFVFIWANDTFAYLTGISIGKHKMFPRISPKKSWEGFIGGLVGTLIVAFAFSYFSETQLNMVEWFGFALIVVIFGTLGDLFESLLKRTIGVKDSGNIMPGHGGLLDRFDSVLLAAPVIYFYLS